MYFFLLPGLRRSRLGDGGTTYFISARATEGLSIIRKVDSPVLCSLHSPEMLLLLTFFQELLVNTSAQEITVLESSEVGSH